MFDNLLIDPSWILSYRTEALNSFFIAFSHYLNFYSYMYIITVGYWLYPKNKVFAHLGFLFPFTVVLNSMIKGFAQIPRPDESLFLVKAFGAHGFPSGDAMLTSLVWFTVFIALKGSAWRYLCLLPILLAAFSRVYLGIHSIYDVTGGILLGMLVSSLFYTTFVQSYLNKWYQGNLMSYWIMSAVLFALYVFVYRDLNLDPFIFSFMGMVLGYGFAAPQIQERYSTELFPYSLESYMNAIIAGIVLYVFVMYANMTALTGIPVIDFTLVLLKYTLLIVLIYAVVPRLIKPVT